MASTKCILIATRTTDAGWHREILLGIREYAEEQRWTLLVQLKSNSYPGVMDYREEQQLTSLARSRGTAPRAPVSRTIAGCILNLNATAALAEFADIPGPKVSYNDRLDVSPVPRVTMDNVQTGRLAAQHFLERNIKNVAFFGVDRESHGAQQRQAGFERALEGHGARCLSFPPETVFEDGGFAFYEWLSQTPKPVGLFAVDDYMARAMAYCCVDWEFEMPGDVLILGVNNDSFLCEFSQPSLSSVIMPSRAIGYKAAEMLDTLMAGRRLARHEVLIPPPGIAARTSTKRAAFGCEELDRALRFIRQNSARGISVKQVIEYAASSQRTLGRLFETHLGHGPGEELRRARLALAKFNLTTTNASIADVARLSGFSNATHLGRVLQRYEKQTPLEYRHRHASVGGNGKVGSQ